MLPPRKKRLAWGCPAGSWAEDGVNSCRESRHGTYLQPSRDLPWEKGERLKQAGWVEWCTAKMHPPRTCRCWMSWWHPNEQWLPLGNELVENMSAIWGEQHTPRSFSRAKPSPCPPHCWQLQLIAAFQGLLAERRHIRGAGGTSKGGHETMFISSLL